MKAFPPAYEWWWNDIGERDSYNSFLKQEFVLNSKRIDLEEEKVRIEGFLDQLLVLFSSEGYKSILEWRESCKRGSSVEESREEKYNNFISRTRKVPPPKEDLHIKALKEAGPPTVGIFN
jgi:hypothetical protein